LIKFDGFLVRLIDWKWQYKKKRVKKMKSGFIRILRCITI